MNVGYVCCVEEDENYGKTWRGIFIFGFWVFFFMVLASLAIILQPLLQPFAQNYKFVTLPSIFCSQLLFFILLIILTSVRFNDKGSHCGTEIDLGDPFDSFEFNFEWEWGSTEEKEEGDREG